MKIDWAKSREPRNPKLPSFEALLDGLKLPDGTARELGILETLKYQVRVDPLLIELGLDRDEDENPSKRVPVFEIRNNQIVVTDFVYEIMGVLMSPKSPYRDRLLPWLKRAPKFYNHREHLRDAPWNDTSRQRLRAQRNYLRPEQTAFAGDPCPKCKSNKTYYKSEQRSAGDEAFHTFLICNSCGEKSRM
jgi:DNA-directed RNA polymerase subunit M/transcription elongation factor TFIIS